MKQFDDVNQVLPIYLCLDVSASMEGQKLNACNAAFSEIHQAIASDPIVNSRVQICLITFSDSAEIVLPLSKMSEVVAFPHIEAKEGTNYGIAFTCLLETIQDDITKLKFLHEKIQRPLVLFISDGEPTDFGWQSSHAAVTDKKWSFSPNIITFGISGSSAETLQIIASNVGETSNKYIYLADDDAHLAVGLKDCIKELMQELNSVPWNPKRTIALTPVHSAIPVYLVLDESNALSEPMIDAINHWFPETFRAISIDPLLAKTMQISIVSFAELAEVLLPLSNAVNTQQEFLGLVLKGKADYEELFLKMQEILTNDFSKLAQASSHFSRPLIVILASSNPTDESWREPHEKLLSDPRYYSPHIVAVGAGGAKASVMSDIATSNPMNFLPMAYRHTGTVQLGELMKELMNLLYFRPPKSIAE